MKFHNFLKEVSQALEEMFQERKPHFNIGINSLKNIARRSESNTARFSIENNKLHGGDSYYFNHDDLVPKWGDDPVVNGYLTHNPETGEHHFSAYTNNGKGAFVRANHPLLDKMKDFGIKRGVYNREFGNVRPMKEWEKEDHKLFQESSMNNELTEKHLMGDYSVRRNKEKIDNTYVYSIHHQGKQVGTLDKNHAMEHLYVDPAHRGKGLATALYKHIENTSGPVKHGKEQTPMGKAFRDIFDKKYSRFKGQDFSNPNETRQIQAENIKITAHDINNTKTRFHAHAKDDSELHTKIKQLHHFVRKENRPMNWVAQMPDGTIKSGKLHPNMEEDYNLTDQPMYRADPSATEPAEHGDDWYIDGMPKIPSYASFLRKYHIKSESINEDIATLLPLLGPTVAAAYMGAGLATTSMIHKVINKVKKKTNSRTIKPSVHESVESRLSGVEALMKRGATKGERDAAKAAYERITRAKTLDTRLGLGHPMAKEDLPHHAVLMKHGYENIGSSGHIHSYMKKDHEGNHADSRVNITTFGKEPSWVSIKRGYKTTGSTANELDKHLERERQLA